MIEVKATEFHNKIGYYIDKLAKGEKILLRSKKHKKYELVIEATPLAQNNLQDRTALIKELIKNNVNTSKKWKSGLHLQRAVRD